ncbi:nucleotide exchange factor GrpE [Arenimonas fontis]|uniref:Protein GrpE n=1 Tax=Arenimonas fontis TaxID=2608255 RepID=A0A5B2ZEQ5_9GAMM|nr:nucleotide exchange factor GrpE [Arenimonas fontis]KAA2286053.1 nucleotide exchange factor GrpE [Arenimonas fontis]
MHNDTKAPGAGPAPDQTPANPETAEPTGAVGTNVAGTARQADADGGTAVEALDTSEAGLAGELERLRAALAAVREESLRERAELENQRKRLSREIEQARRFANERLLADLLPVFDSLDAGLAALGEQTGPVRDGLEATRRQLLKVGADHGLGVIDPAGEAFDPAWHQAVSQVPAAAGTVPGTVVQVFQKGYVLNERLLRPAMVVVAAE